MKIKFGFPPPPPPPPTLPPKKKNTSRSYKVNISIFISSPIVVSQNIRLALSLYQLQNKS